jgi:hypothetical protein
VNGNRLFIQEIGISMLVEKTAKERIELRGNEKEIISNLSIASKRVLKSSSGDVLNDPFLIRKHLRF